MQFPLWFHTGWLRRGVSYFLPAIGTTTSMGDDCLMVAWLKWSVNIGWRGF